MLKFDEVVFLGRALILRRAHFLLGIGDIFIVLVDNCGIGWFTCLQEIIEVLKCIDQTVIMFVSQHLVVEHLISNLIG